MIPLRFLIRLPLKTSNKVIDPFFVTSKCNLPVKDLTEKTTLLVYTLLVYNTLLGYECVWVLGIIYFSPNISEVFNYVREIGNMFSYLYSL